MAGAPKDTSQAGQLLWRGPWVLPSHLPWFPQEVLLLQLGF